MNSPACPKHEPLAPIDGAAVERERTLNRERDGMIAAKNRSPLPAPRQASAPGHPSKCALILAFAAIYTIWGSTYLGIRITLETMPPFMMASARFLFAG